jgi:cell envelope opacity-associated protein A
MKWMGSSVMVVVAVSVAASAQSARGMDAPMKSEKMEMTYTGCVESVNHGSSFLLTHIADDHQAMNHDMATMKDDMAMKKDDMAMKKEMAAKGQTMPSDDMRDEPVMSKALILTGSSNVKKHVGHKVTVMGSLSADAMGSMRDKPETLSVRSLKLVAKSCS